MNPIFEFALNIYDKLLTLSNDDYDENKEILLYINDIKPNLLNDLSLLRIFIEILSGLINARPRIEQIILNIIEDFSDNIPKELILLFGKNIKILSIFYKRQIISIDDIKNWCGVEYDLYAVKFENLLTDSNLKDGFDMNYNSQSMIISKLIRKDNIDEFQEFAEKNNLDFNSKIEYSIIDYPTFNVRDAEKDMPTLIEYASFFGSGNIFKYLLLKNVEIGEKIMNYSVIGGNLDIIHILEDKNKTFSEDSLINAVKYSQNEIADYLIQNHNIQISINVLVESIQSFNLPFFIQYFYIIKEKKFDIQKLFLAAVVSGRLEIIKLFLEKSDEFEINLSDIFNYKSENDQTILHIAARSKIRDVFLFLNQQKEINKDQRDQFGVSLIYLFKSPRLFFIILYIFFS